MQYDVSAYTKRATSKNWRVNHIYFVLCTGKSIHEKEVTLLPWVESTSKDVSADLSWWMDIETDREIGDRLTSFSIYYKLTTMTGCFKKCIPKVSS